MKNKITKFFVLTLFVFQLYSCNSNAVSLATIDQMAEKPKPILPGATNTQQYFPLLEGKNIGVVVNQTATIGRTHLVDSLLSMGLRVKTVFAPEHGFRGTADAGEKLTDGLDPQTNLPVISLYGKRRKPGTAEFEGLDVIIFDVQDVGARFYTYISTMHYVMEACAEQKKAFMVFDRPNPNGHYVDGPVLDTTFRSFVGMHPIPVVHGMTIGEYAQMINGEGWLAGGIQCDLTVIPCRNYDHKRFYQLPIKPSPNLPDMKSIYWYPSTCFFEGTILSEGRGTPHPFQYIGHPDYTDLNFTFTPVSMPGAKYPKLQDQKCYGIDLSKMPITELQSFKGLQIQYVIEMYQKFPDQSAFFNANGFFDKLAGGTSLREQIIAGESAETIRNSWQTDLDDFMKIRAKYLLYPDFD